MTSPQPFAALKCTELETLAICLFCMLLAALLSLVIECMRRADDKRRELLTLTEDTDFCEDLADVGADQTPPIQAYKPPLTDVLL